MKKASLHAKRAITPSRRTGVETKKGASKIVGSSASSTAWLQRKAKDEFTKKAHEQGYAARSAFKLKDILYKYRKYIKNPRTAVDLGAAPGSWTQVLLRHFKGIKVVSVDMHSMVPIPKATQLKLDFMEPGAEEKVIAALEGRKPELIVSDMAPHASGIPQADHLRLMSLSHAAFEFALKVLKPGGTLVLKASRGGQENQLQNLAKQHFAKSVWHKPPASFSSSSEIFLVSVDFQRYMEKREAEEKAKATASAAGAQEAIETEKVDDKANVTANTVKQASEKSLHSTRKNIKNISQSNSDNSRAASPLESQKVKIRGTKLNYKDFVK